MNQTRKTSQITTRRLRRPLGRPATRSGLRRVIPRRPGPDEWAQAITAYRRAVRCHRRLAKLAPPYFDFAVVDRDRHNRAERRRWMALWTPTINRAYGLDPAAPSPEPAEPLPLLPPPDVQLVVDQLLAELPEWLAAGREALGLYRQRHPHGLPSVTQLARLLELAYQLRCLACGLDFSEPDRPALPTLKYDDTWDDLHRAYPQPPEPAPNPTDPPDRA